MRIRLQLLTLALCGTVVSIALAHEGGHDHSSGPVSVRTWTLTASGAHFHGSFVTANETKASFEREDGRVISIDRAELIPQDQEWIVERLAEIKRVNELRNVQLVAQRGPAKPGASKTKEGNPAPDAKSAPEIHQHFLPFKESLGLRWDERFYYVESNGMPDHPMMTGITAWQQQVPLPQSYTGNNAWQIPLFPVPDERPMSCKTNFFRGAIALAVNGVPIFNPIKNDGKTDTFIAGELDQWGGHCGRADDYHYHLPPVHLEKTVGEHKPIAYALDGYPIYGYQEQTDPDYAPLDWLNGHTDSDGSYHYHSTKTYPYLNGGFYGVVTERDGQVDPQPRAKPVRPSLTPLRGAKITGFDRSDDNRKFRIELDVSGKEQSVEYALTGDSVQFTFNDGRSESRTETYRLSNQGNRPAPGGQQRRGGKAGKQPQPRGDNNRHQSEATQPRRPWIQVHASEMDTNQDGMLTRVEVQAEASKAFAAYVENGKGTLLLSDLSTTRPVRSAMGGFIREHAKELDRDDDGKLTKQEILSNAERMFDKADADSDGRITITDEQKPTGQTKVKPEESPKPNRPASSSKARSATATSQTHPNIIFILIDDMGWRDVGIAGNNFVETPNIDRLADEGVRFTQAYASAPNCAPTRACLMSGQYTPRHGVYTVIDPRHEPGQPHHRIFSAPSEESLSGDCITIAELLQQHGYSTACFGMWNLGRGRNGPTTALGQGFDHYEKPQGLGFEQNGYFDRNGRYLTDVLFDEGMRFIEQQTGKPFFLYLPTHAVHAPFDPKPDLVEKYQQKAARLRINDADATYAAMIEAVDDNVGRLLSHLERLSLSENTMVVFTSDNGGTPQYVAPLNGSKGALYEGGIRVPCAVWWSGIENPGRSCDEPILSMDFYPTLAALAGAKLPNEQQIDGVNLLPAIAQGAALDRKSVFWHFPCYIGRGEPCSAIRSGDWKLIQKFENQSLELYNLSDDPGETRNLAAKLPERTQELKNSLSQWQTSLAAPTPTEPNPSFDPTSVRQGKKQRGRGANTNRKKQLSVN